MSAPAPAPALEAAVLVPFRAELAAEILGWARSADDLRNWCARNDFPLRDPAVFAAWHADPDVRPFVLCCGERLLGYGEVWIDRDEEEVELGRILVAPDVRGRGVGRRLTDLLLAEARTTGLPVAWVRVVPSNAAAIACYESAGFRRAPPAREAELNAVQPTAYAWLGRTVDDPHPTP